MNYNSIVFEKTDSTGRIKFNRPTVLNSFNREMGAELKSALDNCRQDPSIRAILLTGEGRAFCAGQDLSEAVSPTGEKLSELGDIIDTVYNPIVKLIREIEKPVVCRVNGVAAGAGANIALACDFVIAAEESVFIQSFSKIGLVPDSGGSYFIPRLVGIATATQLMMLGDKLHAAEASEMGLIYRAVSIELLDETVEILLQKLVKMPTKALGLIKKMINQSFENTFEQQLDLEKECQEIAGKTDDYIEGVKSFLEKRKPVFKGE
ncbi:MAG: enoyl-CoA hydratase/isomerase family protein [Melioribacteraceae bacterium]|nr:enoyl-CoA hydratase/isomerase family protein [Melioribacteraceae bacterium]MCF8263062.1 enoyl-CoA hydratase/isomerase family protein [Melioribacteraceae bacterium]MCF8413845.1 enoyl-CoA hydratase/isomerase family protein [Melioribacteraceae bacterium]MCF8431246.1 enoyl-CoA hydratase/isomerase family protein [Melioribacteraceae bacterium]